MASNVQAVPFAERYTSTAGLRATVAGRSRMNPSAVTVTPLIWAWAPCPAGAPGGTASVQVVPPLPLSQAALVWRSWPACRGDVARDQDLVPVGRGVPDVQDAAGRLAARWSWAAPSRCQVIPLADRKITGVPPADPAAMKPVAVRLTTLI